MAERDAFGREKDEDGLAGLGWTAGGQVTPPGPSIGTPAVPADPASPAAPASLAGSVPPARPPSSRPAVPGWTPPTVSVAGIGWRVVLSLALLLAVLLPVVLTIGHTASTVSRLRIPTFPAVRAPTVPAARVTPPRHAGSLLRTAPFSHALAALGRGRYGRLRSVRVQSDRVDAQFVTRGGRLREVQVPAGGRATVLSTSPPGFPQGDTISLASLDRHAPARLAAGVRRRTRSRVDYAVTTGTGIPSAAWTVIAGNGTQYLADAHGRITRRIN